MSETTKSEHNRAVQALALLLFLLGIALLFVFPIGTIVGIILICATPTMGYKKAKIWKCDSCAYFFERA